MDCPLHTAVMQCQRLTGRFGAGLEQACQEPPLDIHHSPHFQGLFMQALRVEPDGCLGRAAPLDLRAWAGSSQPKELGRMPNNFF